MADFSTPFADNGERREPASDEQSTGFGCGAASLPLFNWMFWAIQAEIGAVIADAGLEPTNTDMTQLLQAIEAKISAATGDGDTSTFLLMSQARTRLPIYPEVNNASGHFGVSSPATGKVRVPSGVSFTHRGIYTLTTTETDFNTDASKIYHLRWNPVDGFILKDLASSVYNPTSVSEINGVFDSSYDDMLVARVITNSSNAPTITNLLNKNILTADGYAASAPFGTAGFGGLTPSFALEDNIMDPKLMTKYQTFDVNFARTPQVYVTALQDFVVRDLAGVTEISMGARALSRYQVAAWAQGDQGHATGWAARA